MNTPSISVIMPIYNASLYIEQCIRSLMEQTLENIEYIFIDDCSTDDTMDTLNNTLDDYKVKNITIITHNENKGIAISRTEGNNIAKGEYLIHCDSDDYVEPDMYEEMLQAAKKHNADIVCCNITRDGATDLQDYAYTYTEESKSDILNGNMYTLYHALWNKLIRRQFIIDNNISFFEGINSWEDIGFTLRARYLSHKTIVVNKPLYHYRADAIDSFTKTNRLSITNDRIQCALQLTEYFKSLGDIEYIKWKPLLYYIQFMSKTNLLKPGTIDIKKWKNTFKESNSLILKYKHIPLAVRLATRLISIV